MEWVHSSHSRTIQKIKLNTKMLNSLLPKLLIPKKLDHCSHSLRKKFFFLCNHTRSYMICLMISSHIRIIQHFLMAQHNRKVDRDFHKD